MKLLSRRREEPDVNLTPLIDVVFLLLIFFMVSTTFERESQIAIELPKANGDEASEEVKFIEITIDAKGRYYVNQQLVINTQLDTLKAALSKVLQGRKEGASAPKVLLSADRNTPHQAVMTAMDAARQVGLVNLTFATSTPQPGN